MNATPTRLIHVSDLLDEPRHWTKKAYFRDEYGLSTQNPCSDGSFCLAGAIIYKHRIKLGDYPFVRSAFVEPFSEDDIQADAKRDILKLVRLIQPDYDIHTTDTSPTDVIIEWNDQHQRTWEEVIDLVKTANI